MNVDIARHIVGAARSSRELAELVPFLKDHLSADEHAAYSKAIGSAVAAIQLDVMNKVLADDPGLESEIEASVAKYGRYL